MSLWFGPCFEIQDGAEDLGEPNQVVYKEKDAVSTITYNPEKNGETNQVVYKDKDALSTITYNSEKNNDSEESRISGYRSTPLERNGWFM